MIEIFNFRFKRKKTTPESCSSFQDLLNDVFVCPKKLKMKELDENFLKKLSLVL